MKLTSNKILITGGASGIGLGLTERFSKNNTIIQLEQGKTDVTFGTSELRAKAYSEAISASFAQMNQ